MSTGSKATDERIARLVAAAPEFTDERFALLKGLLQSNLGVEALMAEPTVKRRPTGPADE